MRSPRKNLQTDDYVVLDQKRYEIAEGRSLEPVMNRANFLLHSLGRELWESHDQSFDQLANQS